MKETLKWSKNIKTFLKLSKSHRLANIRKESLFQGFKMGEFFSYWMCRGRALKSDGAITKNDLSPSVSMS